MHSHIVNGYQLLCNTHTVYEQYRGTAALFVLLTIILFRFLFLYVCHSDTPISFSLGASILCVHNSLRSTLDLVL